MNADSILSKLDRVRARGDGRWTARCPAHDDSGPSLSVRELEDGRVLMHCFAGCSALAVVESIGLTIGDLFPARSANASHKRERRPFIAIDALRCVAHEALFAAMAARTVAKGTPLLASELERLWQAASRLQAAVEVVDA